MSLRERSMLIHPESIFVVCQTHFRRISMSQSTISVATQYSSHASLAGLVAHVKARGIFEEVRGGLHIEQKTVKDSPQDKVQDILVALLCGVQRLVELNTLLRQEVAGRSRCAEQSVAQQTLDAATAENVAELQAVLTRLL